MGERESNIYRLEYNIRKEIERINYFELRRMKHKLSGVKDHQEKYLLSEIQHHKDLRDKFLKDLHFWVNKNES